MNATQVSDRLNQTGLSDLEKQAVRDRLVAGLITPSGWTYVNDDELTQSLRNIIQQGKALLKSLY